MTKSTAPIQQYLRGLDDDIGTCMKYKKKVMTSLSEDLAEGNGDVVNPFCWVTIGTPSSGYLNTKFDFLVTNNGVSNQEAALLYIFLLQYSQLKQ